MKKPLNGIIPPILTPLRQRDELDVEGVEHLVEHLIQGGVHGIFALGTTGEFASLSEPLKRQMVANVCRATAGRLPVLVGITHTSFDDTVKLARDAADMGADALVLSTPYYFSISQEELLGYFREITPQLPLPVFLYNIPSCTKVSIDVDTVKRTMDLPNVIGFKDSSGVMTYFHQLAALGESYPDWSLLMGPEELLAESVLLGGQGGVCGGANLCPRLYVSLYEAAVSRDLDTVKKLHQQVIKISSTLYRVGAYGSSLVKSLKASLKHLGICEDVMAGPFVKFDDTEQAKVKNVLHELGITRQQPWPSGCEF